MNETINQINEMIKIIEMINEWMINRMKEMN